MKLKHKIIFLIKKKGLENNKKREEKRVRRKKVGRTNQWEDTKEGSKKEMGKNSFLDQNEKDTATQRIVVSWMADFCKTD
jgi:hypothetical protein